MPLTEVQKIQVRRHLGYPVAGLLQISPAGGTLAQASVGYRFFQAYGSLEYRMNNMSPGEEAVLLGQAVGAVALVGPQPSVGDSVTVTISGGGLVSPVALNAVAPTPTQGIDGRLTLCNTLASLAGLSSPLVAAGIRAATPYGTGPFAANAVPLPEISFVGPTAFAIASSFSGVLPASITSQGVLVDPSTSLDGTSTVHGYLPILAGLESAHAGTSQNLDTIKADVWQGRSNEAGQRWSLYELWRRQMADFLGLPINVDARARPGRVGAMRFA